jgi:hypothetical protein
MSVYGNAAMAMSISVLGFLYDYRKKIEKSMKMMGKGAVVALLLYHLDAWFTRKMSDVGRLADSRYFWNGCLLVPKSAEKTGRVLEIAMASMKTRFASPPRGADVVQLQMYNRAPPAWWYKIFLRMLRLLRQETPVTFWYPEPLLNKLLMQCYYVLQEKAGDTPSSLSVMTRMLQHVDPEVYNMSEQRYIQNATVIAAVGYFNGTLDIVRRSKAVRAKFVEDDGEEEESAELALGVPSIAPPTDPQEGLPNRECTATMKPVKNSIVIVVKERTDRNHIPLDDALVPVAYETMRRTAVLSEPTAPYADSRHNEECSVSRHAQEIEKTKGVKKSERGRQLLDLVGQLLVQHFVNNAKELYGGDIAKYPRSWSQGLAAFMRNTDRKVPIGHQNGALKLHEINIPDSKLPRGLAHGGQANAAASAEYIDPAECIWKKLFVGRHIKGQNDRTRIGMMCNFLRESGVESKIYSNDYGAFDSTIDLEDKLWETQLVHSVVRVLVTPLIGQKEADALDFGGPLEYRSDVATVHWDMKHITVMIGTEDVWRFSGERGTSFFNWLQNYRVFLSVVLNHSGIETVQRLLHGNSPHIGFVGEGDDSVWRMPGRWGYKEDTLAKFVGDNFGKVLEPVMSKPNRCEFCSWHFFVENSVDIGFPKPRKFFEKSQLVASKDYVFVDGKCANPDFHHHLCAGSLLALAEAAHQAPFLRRWLMSWAEYHISECSDDKLVLDDWLSNLVALELIDEPEDTLSAQKARVQELIEQHPMSRELCSSFATALAWGTYLSQEEWNKTLACIERLDDDFSSFVGSESAIACPRSILEVFDFGPVAKFLGIPQGDASDVLPPPGTASEATVAPAVVIRQDGSSAHCPKKTQAKKGKGTAKAPGSQVVSESGGASGSSTSKPSAKWIPTGARGAPSTVTAS